MESTVLLQVILDAVSVTCVIEAARTLIDPPLNWGIALCDLIAGSIWTGTVLYLQQIWPTTVGTLAEPVLEDTAEPQGMSAASETLPITAFSAQPGENATPLAETAAQLIGTVTQLVEAAAHLVGNATGPTP